MRRVVRTLMNRVLRASRDLELRDEHDLAPGRTDIVMFEKVFLRARIVIRRIALRILHQTYPRLDDALRAAVRARNPPRVFRIEIIREAVVDKKALEPRVFLALFLRLCRLLFRFLLFLDRLLCSLLCGALGIALCRRVCGRLERARLYLVRRPVRRGGRIGAFSRCRCRRAPHRQGKDECGEKSRRKSFDSVHYLIPLLIIPRFYCQKHDVFRYKSI